MSDASLSVEAAPPPADEPLVPFLGRLSDRLNPILVREAQQSLNGRAFIVSLGLALAAIVLVGLSTSTDTRSARIQGWNAFVTGMQVLVPLLFLVVPMQAFLSTRQEVAGGTIEHLLLSRLSPGAVVRGKIAASAVESLLFFSVFAPLLALTFLLRGVDVPTIGTALVLAFAYSVAASTFAIAMGSLSRWPAVRTLPMIFAVLVLMAFAAQATFGMPYLLREVMRSTRAEGRGGLLAYLVPAVLSAPIFYLLASAALAHPYENRSTPFRVFALAGVLGTATWVAWYTERYAGPGGGGGSSVSVPDAIHVAAYLCFPFWLFAVTEDARLSPRVRTLVPKHPLLAALSVPFLPGGARGLLFTILLTSAALASALVLPEVFGGVSASSERFQEATVPWSYLVLYAAMGRLLRARLPSGPRGTILARFLLPIGIGLLAVLPHLIDAFVGGPAITRTWLIALDPFYAAGSRHYLREASFPVAMLWVVAAIFVLVQIGALADSAGEVMRASKERRKRAA